MRASILDDDDDDDDDYDDEGHGGTGGGVHNTVGQSNTSNSEFMESQEFGSNARTCGNGDEFVAPISGNIGQDGNASVCATRRGGQGYFSFLPHAAMAAVAAASASVGVVGLGSTGVEVFASYPGSCDEAILKRAERGVLGRPAGENGDVGEGDKTRTCSEHKDGGDYARVEGKKRECGMSVVGVGEQFDDFLELENGMEEDGEHKLCAHGDCSSAKA